MGIPMTGYKMIYKNVIYNLISICFYNDWDNENKVNIIREIEAVYIDESNRIKTVKDKVNEFQILSK